jgi:hypothetical protein
VDGYINFVRLPATGQFEFDPLCHDPKLHTDPSPEQAALPFVKNEKDGEAHARETGGVIPAEFFAEADHGKDSEDGERDAFLNRLELRGRKFVRADAVGGTWKQYSKNGDAPDENYFPEGFAAKFQVAIPGEGHEDVGDSEKQNGAHGRIAS